MQDVKVPGIKSLIINSKENNQKPKMFNYCLYIWYWTEQNFTSNFVDYKRGVTLIMYWSVYNHKNLTAYIPGGYSWQFLVEMCRSLLHILTRFQTKKCNFPHRFSHYTSKIHTSFQTWPLSRNYIMITWIIV